MEQKRIVVKCCRCRRIKLQDEWVYDTEESGVLHLFSHSYCPVCLEKINAEPETAAVAAAG